MRIIKDFILGLSQNSFFRNLIKAISASMGKPSYGLRAIYYAFFQKINFDFTVRRGPFKGLKNNQLENAGGKIIPELLGCYEMELHPVFEEVISKKYDFVLDVGCAEGYYACGLAMRMPDTTVVAYDIEENALNLCKKMAQENKVIGNMRFESFCSPDTLKNFDFGHASFILCDCEGYEYELFTDEVIAKLSKCDLLIEMHDKINPLISATLKKRFTNSHVQTVFETTERNFSQFPELTGFSETEKQILISEGRGGLLTFQKMEWLYLKAKKA